MAPALLLLALAAALALRASACDSACSLRFCDGATAYSLRGPLNVAFTGAICTGGRRVDVAQTGEALVNGEPISVLPVPPYSASFPRSFFKAFVTPHGAAIGRENARGNQLALLDGSCVSIPVSKVAAGSLNVDVSECVAFKVRPTAPAAPPGKPQKTLPVDATSADTKPVPSEPVLRMGSIFAARRHTLNVLVGTRHLRRELYVVADATGSMGALLRPLQQALGPALRRGGWTRSGLARYRDEWDIGRGYVPVRALGGEHWRTGLALGAGRSDRGGDPSEAALHALTDAAEGPDAQWSAGAVRAVLWLGDAPGHEPSCAGGRMATRASAAAALRKQGIAVIAVDLARGSRGLDSRPAAYRCKAREYRAPLGQATHIARATGGSAHAARRGRVAQVVRKALAAHMLRVSADASHCGGLVVVERVALPGGLRVGEGVKKAVAHVFVSPKACSRRWGFSCTIRFRAGKAIVGQQQIVVNRVRGCPRLPNGKFF